MAAAVGVAACGDTGPSERAGLPDASRRVPVAADPADPSEPAGLDSPTIQALPNALEPLVTPTYDGTGQAVEPTVLSFARPWRGHRYWMAVSAYPFGDDEHEDPSILASDDGLAWSVPEGLANPLVRPRRGHLADATLVYDDASDALWVYYLDEAKVDGINFESLDRVTSADGVRWSAPEPVLAGELYPLLSPSVVKRGRLFTMWTVDGGLVGCGSRDTTLTERTSLDGLHWSDPQPVAISQPGYVLWHVNMTAVPETGHVLAAISAFPRGRNCNRTRLFLADSDGASWETFGDALLSPGRGWDDEQIYRSSPLYDAGKDTLRLWYSARSARTNAWHIGYTEGKLSVP